LVCARSFHNPLGGASQFALLSPAHVQLVLDACQRRS
jgi:hypothetical protein